MSDYYTTDRECRRCGNNEWSRHDTQRGESLYLSCETEGCDEIRFPSDLEDVEPVEDDDE